MTSFSSTWFFITDFCADKNNALVKYSLPEDNKTIIASKYHLYLPTEKQLLKQLKTELNELEESKPKMISKEDD
jgi:hypothetical protein